MSDAGTRCMWMRGGTSKGAFFLAEDLPADITERDALLLKIMGSPDPRQIDGMGGANPLTSKVAVVKASGRAGVDVDYLFLQVFVDQAIVTDAQPCGNMLAGVGPFAIERGLVKASGSETPVAIFMENTGEIATATVTTLEGRPVYEGNAAISGVPGSAAPIPLAFKDIAGSSCGALLPSGNAVDTIDGVAVTLIDNGMPVVVLAAADMGISGEERPAELEANETLKARLEKIRLAAGPMMNLGDVSKKSVPKMTMVAPSQSGYALTTRTFIPHRCHDTIGVFGAVSVATAALLPGSPANRVAVLPPGDRKTIAVGHPEGETSVVLDMENGVVRSAAILRTARKLFDGYVF
jgi:4-oxalomesaconate tautomerase